MHRAGQGGARAKGEGGRPEGAARAAERSEATSPRPARPAGARWERVRIISNARPGGYARPLAKGRCKIFGTSEREL
jgi:hypothetical protein